MRIIANENVMASVIRELRSRGHDVLWVKESMPKAEDEAILARAQFEDRLVLTHDKDFGELAFRRGLPASCDIVLIRLWGDAPQADQDHVLRVLESRADWEGNFSVVHRGRVRMRKLPTTFPQKPK